MDRHLARQLLLDRRRFLAHAARISGASLASIPLVGCGADEESAGNDTGAADTGAGDSATADSGGSGDTGVAPDTATPDIGEPESPIFRFAIVADTHIIDEHYTGPESNELDTMSMFFTEERFTAARDFLMRLDPAPEFVCHVGDLIHDYVDASADFMFENVTRLDKAKEIVDGFGVPFHLCLGNHDYEFRDVERSVTHDLFREKGLFDSPYHSFEHRGWKFIFLDTYLGETHNPVKPRPSWPVKTAASAKNSSSGSKRSSSELKAVVHFPAPDDPDHGAAVRSWTWTSHSLLLALPGRYRLRRRRSHPPLDRHGRGSTARHTWSWAPPATTKTASSSATSTPRRASTSS